MQQRPVQPPRNGYDPLKGLKLNKKTHRDLFSRLCEYDNLQLAFMKARKRKSSKEYVKRFEEQLQLELVKLQWELLTGIYRPRPLKTFTVRDPKTRKISASNFRDRVVHHAICNLLEPIFERRFIHDTFANRKGKGTKATLERMDAFLRRVSGPQGEGFALKADIRKYFESVDQKKLLEILGRKVKDRQLLQLISIILQNHKSDRPGKGMPLGNLTSQFFANVFLGELDYFVKHGLGAKHYLRYVDDFVILGRSREQLEGWQKRIGVFLQDELRLQLHPDKTKIISLRSGVPLVGFRVFRHYKLLKKNAARRIFRRLDGFERKRAAPQTVRQSVAGLMGYLHMGNTFRLRERVRSRLDVMEVAHV